MKNTRDGIIRINDDLAEEIREIASKTNTPIGAWRTGFCAMR